MHTSTRQGEGAGELARVEYYETSFGTGRVRVAGDLPLEVDLPSHGCTGPPAGAGRSHWAAELERYFAGEPVSFSLDVDAFAAALGLTSFERDVYAALSRVPYGTAVSYRDLAFAAGRPNAYRATGSVMARNVLPIVLPCHRVVKNDGRLGFYGDDPAWKRTLLELEGVRLDGVGVAGRGRR